jgi:hypothetical protein
MTYNFDLHQACRNAFVASSATAPMYCSGPGQLRKDIYDCDGDGEIDVTCENPAEGFSGYLPSKLGANCLDPEALDGNGFKTHFSRLNFSLKMCTFDSDVIFLLYDVFSC